MAQSRVIITGGSGFVGTNLVQHFTNLGWEVINLDLCEPRNIDHRRFWKKINLLDKEALQSAFQDFRPSLLLHMGARTDLGETKNLAGYASNTVGTKNIVDVVNSTPSIERAIYASSRLVFRIGHNPESDYDYSATTTYGKSKIAMEKIVIAQSESDVPWTLVRPTSIWGPWFDVPYRTFFNSIQRGRYIHPRGNKILKSFGYVGNTVHQIEHIASAPIKEVRGKVLFLADYEPLDVLIWGKKVQEALGAAPIRQAPYPVLKSLARAGDLSALLGLKNPPLTSFRLNNLVANMVYDLSPTKAVVGELPFSMEEGVIRTVEWMRFHK